MSQSSRDIILARLESADKRVETGLSIQSISDEAQALLENSPHAPLNDGSPVDAFMARIKQGKVIGTSCEQLQSMDEIPGAVADYLVEKNLSTEIGIQKHPVFEQIDWQGLSNTGPQLDGLKDGLISLTFADFGIAETGSVVFHSGENKPVLLNFLSLHQIIVIQQDSIVSLLDDYAKQIDVTKTPRNTIFITGASGTTDIEGVLVQGAHGPSEVHIFIINGSNK